jgi:hypothetical protein
MPGHNKTHRHLRGKTSLLDQDEELASFCLNEFMNGGSVSEISRLVNIRFFPKKISPISIKRWIDKQISDIDPEKLDEDTIGKTVTDAFDETSKSFNDLFSDIRENVNLNAKQDEQLDQVQRKVNLNLNLAKKKFKIYKLQLRIADTEIQDTLQEFLNQLTGSQKEMLSEMIEELFLPDQLISDKDRKKYKRYQRKRVKDFYKVFPQGDKDSMEVT